MADDQAKLDLPTQASAELFRAIAEYTYDWESWIDDRGETRWINHAVERISGYTVKDCMARADYPLFLAYQGDHAILLSVLDDAAQGGSGNDVEFRIVHKQGSLRWVAISWQAVRASDGTPLGYRTSVRDIDHRKRIEEELHAIRRRAEALALARSELLANVSHELRSPAHCISGFAELLLQENLPAKQRRYVELIADQGRSMLRQVEDLLSLTALEAGGVELTAAPLDLEELCKSLIEGASAVARARGIELRYELLTTEHWVEGDVLRLKQVVRNLLDNALKFTEQGSVVLRVSQLQQWLAFDVVDTGIGMTPEQVDVLRLPFRQADASSSRRHGGVGLGLAIVDRLVQAMGGSLTIESTPGRGTTVRVRVPFKPAEAVEGEVPSARPVAELSGTALVVDDSATASELLSRMLERYGFDSVQVSSAEAAKRAASSRPFEVVFLDYQMPDSDGAETAVALRRALSAHGNKRHVPIYILTANVFVHEQLRGVRSSVDGILTKPLSLAALGQVLTTLKRGEDVSVSLAELLDLELVQELTTLRARNGQTMLQKLLPQVSADMERTLMALDHQLAEGAWDQAAREAHSVAGHAAVVGAVVVRDTARDMEGSLRAATPELEVLELTLHELRRTWAQSQERLQRRVAAM